MIPNNHFYIFPGRAGGLEGGWPVRPARGLQQGPGPEALRHPHSQRNWGQSLGLIATSIKLIMFFISSCYKQLSADTKIKNFKIRYSFVNPRGRRPELTNIVFYDCNVCNGNIR